MKTEISKETPINRIIEEHPEAVDVFMAYGLHCIGCHFSEFDTVEDGARIHGMDDEDIELMMRDANKTIKGTKNEKTRAKTKPKP